MKDLESRMLKKLLILCVFLLPLSVTAASKGQFVQQRQAANTVVISGLEGKSLKELVKDFEKSFDVKLKLKKQKVRGEANLYSASRVISGSEQDNWEQLAEDADAQVFFPIIEATSKESESKVMQKRRALPTRSKAEK